MLIIIHTPPHDDSSSIPPGPQPSSGNWKMKRVSWTAEPREVYTAIVGIPKMVSTYSSSKTDGRHQFKDGLHSVPLSSHIILATTRVHLVTKPSTARHIPIPKPVVPRVPGLSIRDCAGSSNNLAQMRPKLSAIDMTGKTFFERLYLVLGLRKFAPGVNRPYAPTTPTNHCTPISRFLWNFFPPNGPSIFFQHNSPSNLA